MSEIKKVVEWYENWGHHNLTSQRDYVMIHDVASAIQNFYRYLNENIQNNN